MRRDYMLKSLKYLVGLSPIKYIPTFGKSYFQVFYVFFGFAAFLKGSLHKLFVPLLLTLLFSCLGSALTLEANLMVKGVARAVQVLCLIGMVHGFIFWFSRKDWNRLFIFWFLIAAVLYYVEIKYTTPVGLRSWGKIERYLLLVGEPNYSGLFYAYLIGFSLLLKRYFWIPVWFVWIMLTFSRTPHLMLLSLVVLFLLYFLFKKKAKPLFNLFIWSLFLQPFIFLGIYHFASIEIFQKLVKVTTRFYLQPLYVHMFLDRPWGVGLGNAMSYYPHYQKLSEPFLMGEVGLSKVHDNEQHSIFVQMLGETGAFGYFFFCLFLWGVFQRLWKAKPVVAIIFLASLPMSFALNTVNEMGFYMMIALCLSVVKWDGNMNEAEFVEVPYFSPFLSKIAKLLRIKFS